MTPVESPLNLHHLRVFQTVARHQSVSRAAAEMVLSQPAVSIHVKKLEEAFGLPLFEKNGRRIFLTDAGQHLYEYSQRVFALLEETSQVMESLRAGERGRLRVAADTTAGVYVVPEYLGAFRRLHPQVAISLEVTNRTTVIRRLMLREADLAIVGQIPHDQEELCATPFLTNELVVIASPVHRFARKPSVPVTSLKDETFLMREPGSGTRATAERFFAEAGVPMHAGMELGSNSTIKEVVANSLGIAVISRRAIDVELQAGRLVILDVQGFPCLRYWHVVYGRGRFLPPAAEAFRSFLLGTPLDPLDPPIPGGPTPIS